MYQFRPATPADHPRIWEIIQQAKAQMYREHKQQWSEAYPAPANITSDIQNGYGYVLCSNNRAIAYCAAVFDGEPAYLNIRGKWLSEQPYVVVHRLAVADEAKRQGIAAKLMLEVETLSIQKGVYSFKVDTNFDNFYMQKLLSKLGFSQCGEVQYQQGARIAYEKIMTR